MKVSYPIIIDFAKPLTPQEILVSQNDHLSRVPRFILRANGKALDVSDVATYTLTALKADKTRSYDSGTLDKDDDGNQINEITYEIPQALTEISGTCTCTITLTSSSGSVLQSFEFYIRNRNELQTSDEDTEDDLAGFRDIITQAVDAIEKINAMANKTALPNPYPLRLIVGDKTYSYSGGELIEVEFTGLAYLEGNGVDRTTVDWRSLVS